jgi:hypothetical protein
VGVETKNEAKGREAKKANTLRRIDVMNPFISIKRVAKGRKKKEKMEAVRLKGTIRKPTQGMMKRLVINPTGAKRLKWRAAKGAVPKMATPVTRRESLIYLEIFFIQEVFRRSEISSCLNS